MGDDLGADLDIGAAYPVHGFELGLQRLGQSWDIALGGIPEDHADLYLVPVDGDVLDGLGRHQVLLHEGVDDLLEGGLNLISGQLGHTLLSCLNALN